MLSFSDYKLRKIPAEESKGERFVQGK